MSPRSRAIAAAFALFLLFAVGAGWLGVKAAGNARSAPNAVPAGDTELIAEPTPTSPPADETSAAPTATTEPTGDPADPPQPRRSVRVAGADLGGNGEGTCAQLFIDHLRVQAKIESITIAASPDPSPGAVVQADATGCADRDEAFCSGASFGPGGEPSCLVGVALSPQTPPGTYTATVTLDLRVHCMSGTPVPCNQITPPVPTEASPVDAIWSDSGPSLTIDWQPPTEQPPTEQPPTEQPPTEQPPTGSGTSSAGSTGGSSTGSPSTSDSSASTGETGSTGTSQP
jgi:hypothetical protein